MSSRGAIWEIEIESYNYKMKILADFHFLEAGFFAVVTPAGNGEPHPRSIIFSKFDHFSLCKSELRISLALSERWQTAAIMERNGGRHHYKPAAMSSMDRYDLVKWRN